MSLNGVLILMNWVELCNFYRKNFVICQFINVFLYVLAVQKKNPIENSKLKFVRKREKVKHLRIVGNKPAHLKIPIPQNVLNP